MGSVSESRIPTIDISPYIQDRKSAAGDAVVRAVKDACTDKGFFQIIGHGISLEMQKEAFDASKAFFALPMEEKAKIDRVANIQACGRGYECFKSQLQNTSGQSDNKEGFYMSCEIPAGDKCIQEHPYGQAVNLWPSADVLPEHVFKNTMIRYHTALIQVTRVVVDIMAAGLPEVSDTFFDSFFDNYPIALLSPKHYPPIPEDTDLSVIGCGPHTDFGAITLLLQDEISGLEVQDGENWIPVPPREGAYVVNIGEMFQKWTRGLYRSTVHQVIPPRKDHRYSIPLFFDGNLEFKLVPFDGAREGEQVHTVEDHLTSRYLKLSKQKNGYGKGDS